MISECSDQNVQLCRLTQVFACHTRRFVKPKRLQEVHTISEGSDQTTDVQAQSVQVDLTLSTFYCRLCHTHSCAICLCKL